MIFTDLPEPIQRHLISLAEETAITPLSVAQERVTENWLAKRALYEEQVAALGMETVESLGADDARGMLLLTWSGSLIALAPADERGREFEYASIKLRTDVPDSVLATGVSLVRPPATNHPAEFANCPVAKSSELLEIATFSPDVRAKDQAERLRQAVIFLTNGFVQANQELSVTVEAYPDQFTMKSVIRRIAERNEVSQTLARSVVNDYLDTIEAGLMLGRRVALGRFGKLQLGVRAAQKARMGRNPATGEEIMIPAKAPVATPRISFSSSLRERASNVPLSRVDNKSGGEENGTDEES